MARKQARKIENGHCLKEHLVARMNGMDPLVSILVATKNGESSIRRLLASLAMDQCVKSGQAEIIVLDDGSTPPISQLPVQQQLRNEQSKGVGGSRNRLTQSASGRYFLILDDDVELVDPATLTQAVNLIQSYNDQCMVAFCELDAAGNRYWLQPSEATVRSWIGRFCGFAFLIPRDMWNKCGGFAEILFYQYEEAEFSYRTIYHGYRILYDPKLAIKHYRKVDPSQRTRVHAWLLRNMMFTTILRFPLLLIPPNFVRCILLYHDFADDRLPVKAQKIWWCFGELMKNLPKLIRQRRRLPLATLKRFRALGRSPEAIVHNATVGN